MMDVRHLDFPDADLSGATESLTEAAAAVHAVTGSCRARARVFPGEQEGWMLDRVADELERVGYHLAEARLLLERARTL